MQEGKGTCLHSDSRANRTPWATHAGVSVGCSEVARHMGTGQLVWGPGEPQQGLGCTWKTLCGISEPRRETLAKQE